MKVILLMLLSVEAHAVCIMGQCSDHGEPARNTEPAAPVYHYDPVTFRPTLDGQGMNRYQGNQVRRCQINSVGMMECE